MQPTAVGPRTFLRLAQATVGVVALNVVSGAAVRLTDSGLGCPDWPTCSQHRLTPPLSFHPVIEFSNRLVVVALCVCAALALGAALARAPRRRDLVWLSAGLLVGVLAEAVIGAVVVYSHLNAYVVMVHFSVGMALLTDAVVLALRAGREPATDSAVPKGARVAKVARRELQLSRLMLGLLGLVIVAGTATTGAGPHAGGKGAKRIPVALADMARVHSGIVIVLAGLTLVVLYRLERSAAAPSVLARGRLLLGAMLAQGVVGYTQYFSHLPALLVGVHVLGVTVVWSAMLWFYDGLWSPDAALPVVAPGGLGAGATLSGVAGPAAP